MAVRIYSLAKELKLDSKVLVDICTKAGVGGKGSALASLTDEEVATVKAFLAGGAAARPAAPVKRATATATGPSGPPTAVAPPAPAATRTMTLPPQSNAVRREDYMAPSAALSDKVPVLSSDKAKLKKKPTPPDAKPPVSRSGPGIKLAPLPTVAQPAAPAPAPEPAPQKPDLKLPVDAIRAGRAGTKPLSEHLRKHEQKRKEAAAEETVVKPESGKAPPRDRGPGRKPAPAAEAPKVEERGRGRGRAVPAVAAEGEPGLLGGREQRQINRKRAATAPRRLQSDEEDTQAAVARPRRSVQRMKRTGTNTAAPRKTNATVELPCTVRSFSEAVGVPAMEVLRKLMAMGNMLTIASTIELETAQLLALDLGVEVNFKEPVDFAAEQLAAVIDREDDPADLQPRPPVITFLGHVDHGKTSLLDKIIGIDVAAHESGGITQHIRAYQIEKGGRKISFVDTPGHEAFTQMRARGAHVTDIAVLVVAADDGVMPQTEEAISHARAANVPIVVALNKIDLPGVDVQRIYQQLAANNLLPTEWGGDVEVIKTSAVTGVGLDDLLETLLTIAELHDLKANPSRPAYGTCLEAELHEGRGVVAKLIVQNGTLRVGDAVVCGTSFGRVKAMYDTLRPTVLHQEALPSTPVNLTGLHEAPAAGERFYVLPDISVARQIAEQRASQSRRVALGGVTSHVTLENLFDRLGQQEVPTLNMILRADVRGSIEAIQKELGKLEHPEVKIKILQATVGGVTEADVHLADASDAIIIGFNVVPDEGARSLADRLGVQIRRYEIIYKVTEDLRAALEGMLKPEKRAMDLGRALVQRTFQISRIGTIAGCRVLAGTMQRNARVRVIRDSRIIGDYPLESLKREKDDAREVREGLECGIKVGGFNDLKEGDVLEAYKIEEVARTF